MLLQLFVMEEKKELNFKRCGIRMLTSVAMRDAALTVRMWSYMQIE